jgi:heme-degrading monooxygenase HmoA
MRVTLLQIFNYSGAENKWWAFKQMPVAAQKVREQGALFAKHLGTGAGEGFSAWPDFSTYCNLSVWPSRKKAEAYLQSAQYKNYLGRNHQATTQILMQAIVSKGAWNKVNPFEEQNGRANPEYLGVLTRASIRKNKLARFWYNVPEVSRSIYNLPGKLYSKGIGEKPLLEQATFSIWDSQKAMQNFAYKQKEHKAVVKKTRDLDWYSEELFARFEILDISGTPLFKN